MENKVGIQSKSAGGFVVGVICQSLGNGHWKVKLDLQELTAVDPMRRSFAIGARVRLYLLPIPSSMLIIEGPA